MLERWKELPFEPVEWCKDAFSSAMPSLTTGGIDLWRICSDDSCYDSPAFFECLSTEERSRADRFRFDKDRRSYRVTHACKRWILSLYTKVSPFALRFKAGEWGKPAIQEQTSSLRFNLSHSKGMTLIGVAQDVEIGVDVESWQSSERMSPIFERFASDRERDSLGRGWEGEMGNLLTGWWVSKEAFIKAVGRGLSLPLGDFTIDRKSEHEWGLGEMPSEFGIGEDYSLRIIPVGMNHLGAVVCKRRANQFSGYSGEFILPDIVSAWR